MTEQIELVYEDYDYEPLAIPEDAPEIPEAFYENFHSFAVLLAKKNLEIFFAGQKLHCGGPVSRAALYAPQVIETMLNTTVIAGVDRAYALLDKNSREFERHHNVTNHMISVLKVLERCSFFGIPPCFRGGILLTWLRLCLGIR